MCSSENEDLGYNFIVEEQIKIYECIFVENEKLYNKYQCHTLEENKTTETFYDTMVSIIDKKTTDEDKNKLINFNKNEFLQFNLKKEMENYQFTLWQGFLRHKSLNFSVNVNFINGQLVNVLQKELNDILTISGRIKHEILNEYMRKVFTYFQTRITIVNFDWISEEKESFNKFFKYFYQRKRYAICKTPSKIVKNIYIIPFPKNSGIPEVLQLFNNKTEHIRESQSNRLIGIIVTKLIDDKNVLLDPRINRKII